MLNKGNLISRMARKDKLNKRRLQTSYITTIISVTLVLFLLGVVGLLVLNAQKLSNYVKENIVFNVYIENDAKEVEIRKLQKILDTRQYVRTTEVITRDEAADELRKSLGEDFVEFLGYNPLLASIDVYLYADYANKDSIGVIQKELAAYPEVKEIEYQESLVHLVNNNVRRISIILFIFSGVMFLIAITLINNTIRLSVYSKRFIINTMQLVGATRGFIRKPFLFRGMVHGLISAFIANGLLIGLIYWAEQEISGMLSLSDYRILIVLFGIVLLLGIFINTISTFFAVNKYLKMKVDRLYY